jgi:catechol 2,3-dioxygenase-like lactoylglutathione lyase family enzyme
MPATGLQHVNVHASNVERSRDFYVGLLGLIEGDRPPFASKGYWLCAGAAPIIHLLQKTADEAYVEGSGCVDHVGLAATDLEATRRQLIDQGIRFVEKRVPRDGSVQIFVRDPDGLRIELNFE